MKKIFSILVCLAMLPFIMPIGAEEEKPPLQLAIYPFNAVGVDPNLGTVVTNAVYRELIKSKKLIVRDQNSTEAAIKELGFSQTGFCADDACKIEVGKIIKAQKLLMGTVEKIDENLFTISMRVVDVQTGATEYQAQQDCPCTKNVEIRDLAIQLANSTILVYLETGQMPAAPKITPSTPAPTTPRVVTAAAPPTEGLIDLFFNALEANDYVSAKRLLDESPGLVHAKSKKNGLYPLHVAAQKGNIEFAKSLIEKGAISSAKDDNGNTPLHFAATKEVAELLLANGADIMAKNNDGMTPLHWVPSGGTAAFLIDHGAQVNAKSNSGESPLFIAVKYKNAEKVKVLLDKGADPNLRGPDILTCIKYFSTKLNANSNNLSALHIAVDKKLTDIITILIEKGADINAKADMATVTYNAITKNNSNNTYKGFAPLHVAVNNGDKGIVELLLSKGADVNAAYDINYSSIDANGDSTGVMPLHDASYNCAPDVADSLIRGGANVNATFHSYMVFGDRSLGTSQYNFTPLRLAKLGEYGNKDKASCEAAAQIIKTAGGTEKGGVGRKVKVEKEKVK